MQHTIQAHFEQSITFVEGLATVSEEQWRMPIDVDKWTVAEIIGHLTPWDEFLYKRRLPFLFTGEALPKAPNEDELNANSAERSRAQSKEETIANFVNGRRQLLVALQQVTDAQWQLQFKIGETELTLQQYLAGFVEHDLHHFAQLQQVIQQ
ncbi:DinB family protein [Lysinibacillus piscis]|uniref:DinB-like domain-containing protein n=1 Tax=Lysinibacillus piscis TaxID=2518931 RepID=A0ABQ5NNF1_9BACI|nr:DinB family protein [Lysinibacillus sp. KH24]GLC89524.1 hypothetical protein LYSBPC_26510 [Lysinibacillus sp. KH24]